MKAAVFRGIGDIELAEVPLPEPGVGEVVVRVQYCGICGSDIEAYHTGIYRPGVIMGHEFAGVIDAVGEGVDGWEKGERVTADSILPCGCCWFCQHGRPNMCQEFLTVGVNIDGGMAEYVRLQSSVLRRLPEEVSTREGSLVEPLSIALHAVCSSALRPGHRVLVMGAGPIGLLTLQCALLAGARQVIVTEGNQRRSALARELGATTLYSPQQENLALEVKAQAEGRGPDVVFVCTGVATAIQQAVGIVRKGGQVFVLGLCAEPAHIDFMSVVLNDIEVRGGYGGYGASQAAIDYLAQGRVKVEPLITHEIGLQDVLKSGFEEVMKPDTDAIKILVKT